MILLRGHGAVYAVRKGTPEEIQDFLSEMIRKVYESEEYQTASKKSLSNIIPGFIDQDKYGEMWASETVRFRKVLAR